MVCGRLLAVGCVWRCSEVHALAVGAEDREELGAAVDDADPVGASTC
jgi:hypothetical protein